MPLYSADIEANSLTPTRIWCLSLAEMKPDGRVGRTWTETDYGEMRKLIGDPDNTFIFHNGCSYDKPALSKILGVPFKATIIDTLFTSWYLEPKRNRHGLEYHGEDAGIKKVEVDDAEWIGCDDGTPEEIQAHLERMVHRCEEDVRIQAFVWKKHWKHLRLLYDNDLHAIKGCLEYLTFKAECAALQEDNRWKLDIEACKVLDAELRESQTASKQQLFDVLPMVAVMAKKGRPKKPFKKDGSMSAIGIKWEAFCEEHGLDFDFGGEHKYQTGWKEPNPGSSTQVKAYLTELGWQPTLFDHKRNKIDNSIRKIPQVKNRDTGDLCPNIQALIMDNPSLKCLETLSIVTHRITITNAFLTNVDGDGFLQALVQGLTNTLRFKHRVLLNIPSLRKPYGARIRGLLIARGPEYELCGSDMCSLEDRIKQHYMMPYDPDYVAEISKEGYDPHIAIALEANMVTPDEASFYKWYKESH